MEFSEKLKAIPSSPIRKLVPFADRAELEGVKIYHLNIGDPDIETPNIILSSLHKFEHKIIKYSNSKGEKIFIDSLVSYYKNLGFTDINCENIQVTIGGSEALLWTFLAICNPKDEIIVFEPFYANYNGYGVMADVSLVPILTKITDGFHLPKASEIEKRINKKTKAILICNPNNPTGTLYTKKELEMLIGICKKYNLFLLSDEVYREFVYDGKKQTSVLEFNYPDGVIVLDSLSKRYSLCGARLGCMVSRNKDLVSLILKFAQVRLSAGFIEQIIAAKINEIPKSYIIKVQKEYEARRNLVIDCLNNIKGVICKKPEGAFYIIARLPVSDSEKFAKWLLTDFRDKNETLMVAPASGFYASSGMGKQEIRIAYVINKKDLKRAMELLELAIKQFNKI